MKKKKKQTPGEEIEKKISDQTEDQKIEQKKPELSEEEKLDRLALAGMLLEGKEDLIKARAEREKKRKNEIVELQSGAKYTIGEIERIVCKDPQPYAPLFPYSNPYLKELYRLYYPE